GEIDEIDAVIHGADPALHSGAVGKVRRNDGRCRHILTLGAYKRSLDPVPAALIGPTFSRRCPPVAKELRIPGGAKVHQPESPCPRQGQMWQDLRPLQPGTAVVIGLPEGRAFGKGPA